MVDFIFNLSPGDVIYDIETYPNVFTICAIHALTNKEWVFEISERKNQINDIKLFISTLKKINCRMVGFNNINFDYPVLHDIYHNADIITVENIYNKAMSIINNYTDRFSHIIWDNQQIVPQIDLFKIHHFDNAARSTSLKVLEFNMRSKTIQELPFDVGKNLNFEQIESLILYNKLDVKETLKFYNISKKQIEFREELSLKYNKNFINHNDTKIGKDYFIMELEKYKPGSCYRSRNGKKEVVQTIRSSIKLGDVILPYIKFENNEFNRILNFYKFKTIKETKGVFEKLSCTVNSFEFHFGTGGLHGSVNNQIIESDENYIIEDWDVASYYPNLSIVNNLHPEHLGEEFCKIYKDVYNQRKKHKKGTSENAMLKLALNGVYGDSNNKYSPFFDPKYTMSITINGQLLLCMLCENLFKSKEVELIQVNTDGLTVKYPKRIKEWVHSVFKWWEDLTKLSLESSEYKKMFVRDVNNYIAVYSNGSIKRKGEYEYEKEWNQNHSYLVVAKCAEAHLINNVNIEDFIKNHTDKLDFMLRTKLPKKFTLLWGDEKIQNVSRYYVSNKGRSLTKIMPSAGPEGAFKRKNGIMESYYQEILREVGDEWDDRIHTKNKTVYAERRSGIHPGWTVEICNNLDSHTISDINFNFYITEVEKLVKPLLGRSNGS